MNLEEIIKLAVLYKIDELKVGDIYIKKSKHETQKVEQSNNKKAFPLSDEELALYSTSPSQLTLEQINELSVPAKKG